MFQDEIDTALLEVQHIFGPMARYGGETHRLEQPTQCERVRARNSTNSNPSVPSGLA